MGIAITLRPYTAEDVERFEDEFGTADGVTPTQWFGHRANLAVARRELQATGFLAPEWGRLVVEANGDWAGRVAWWQRQWGPADSWCWQFGILLRGTWRGHGVGTKAQQMLVDYLFAHTRADRVEAYTDIVNVAEQRALEKAGFSREGVLRGAQWRAGEWHDQVMYARLRTDAADSDSNRQR